MAFEFDSSTAQAENTFDWATAVPYESPKPPSLTDRLGFGIRNTIDYGRIAATNDKDEIAGIVADVDSRRTAPTHEQVQMQKEYDPYRQRANEADGVVDTTLAYGSAAAKRLGQFAQHPREFAGMIAENLPNSAPGMAAGLAGAALGSQVLPGWGTAVGGVVGGTAGGYAVEQGSSMLEQIQKEAQARGINPQDKAAMSAMIGEKYSEFLPASQRKGVGTAGTDALLNTLTMGVAGAGERVLAKEARALAEGVKDGSISATKAAEISADISARNAAMNTLGAKTLRGAGITGSEMAGEGLSEAAGQKYAYGNVDAGDVIDESLLGLGQGVGMAAGHKAIDRVTGASDSNQIDDYLKATAPQQQETPPDQPPLIGSNPDAGAMVVFKDGTTAYRSDFENALAAMPEDERAATMARVMGYAPQSANPDESAINPDDPAIPPQQTKSEAMGLVPTDAPSITNAAIAAVETGAHDIEQENAAQEQASTLEQAAHATKVEAPKVDQKNIAIEIAKSLREGIAADAQAGVIRPPQEQERSMLLGLLDVQDGGNLSNQELESRLSAKQRKDFEWLQNFSASESIATARRNAQQQPTTQSDLPTTPTTGETYGNQNPSTQQKISSQQSPGQDANADAQGQKGLLNPQTLAQHPYSTNSGDAQNNDQTTQAIAPEAQQPAQQPGAKPTPAPLSVPDRLRAQREQLSAPALPSINLPKDERQRQQALKGELRDRLGLTPGQTQAAPKRSPFKEFIVANGISDSPADVVGESNAFRANNILPRAFRKNGLSLDALAERAVQAGYITQDDLDAGNAHTVLASMIQDEVAGRKVHLPMNMQTDDAAAKMESYRRAEMEDAADKYGLPYDQYTRTDNLASMVRRVQTRLEQPDPTGLLKPERILRNAQDAVARIERKRAQESERYQQFAKLTSNEQDAAIDVLTGDNGHPIFARRADLDAHAAWHQAQQQWSDLYGEAYTPDNAEQQSVGKDQAPTAGITEASPGSAQGNDTAAQPGSAPVQDGTGQDQQEQTFGLTSPNRSDVLTQQAAIEAEAARKEQGGDKPITRKVTADQVDLFNPQGGLFDAPADDPAPPPTNLKEGLERIRAKNAPAEKLPAGWTESAPGRLATNEDPATGGIVDTAIGTGKWFAISNETNGRIPGDFNTRAEAIAALGTQDKTGSTTDATDLNAMFDDVLSEELARRQPAESPKSVPEKIRAARAKRKQGPRTATQATVSAVKNTASALNNAIDGLGALFGGNTSGRLGSGLSFDEDTYAKAKPLFQAAIANLADAGSDIKEAMRAIVKMVLDKFGSAAAQNMKPYVVRFIQDVQSGNDAATTDNHGNGVSNVPSTDNSVERNSAVASAERTVGYAIQDDAGGTTVRPGEAGGRTTGSTGRGQQDGDSVPTGSTTATGERGNQRLHHVGGQSELTSIVTGADFSERGGDSGITGVPPEPISTSQVDAAADQSHTGLKAGIERARANKVPVTTGDIDNIRATLPQLLPGQQEDVKLAETRFAKVDGYGMLFTNGTGTGKTFSGLGVIKRFALQGKNNTLIVAPDNKIGTDWIDAGKRLGLDITLLKDTKDSGKGIVITTYANLGENDTLASRKWDLVVSDEAHSLMQAANGEPTSYLYNLRAITNHPDGAHTRFNMLHRAELDRATALGKGIEEIERDMSASDTTDMRRSSLEAKSEKMQSELGDLRKKLDAAKAKVLAEVKASQGAGRTRLVALSATPFAYEKTIDWANGYLFDYNEGQASEEGSFRGYNAGSNKDRYMMQHFGYSMRYNKLTQPDSKVDRGLMQRQWNASLKKSGALSGRMLEVKPDYDRRFILVESAIGNRIDEALDWISEQRQAEKGQGPYSDLGDAINEQFKYLQKRYLLEAIKATEVIPIVKQHLAMGRKVVVFHDYKKGGGFNPFRVNTAVKSDMAAAVREFEAKFKDLVNAPLGSMPSPIEVFSRELPQTLLINGDEKQADLLKRYKSFQDDANGPQVMLVQSAKNKGWSGHDTTGKHQRVLINLGQPTAPTLAIQQEGRIYRTGQASDAIMRYMNTGTNWERWTFATTIAGRASTAENLGMGEMARALKDSFIQSFEESDAYPPGHENEGKGGKERDKAANDAITEYDRAKTFYFGQQKKNSKTKAQEGADYFATPEPIGLKMAQWLDARGGEDVLEPSAGHGAIARWIPDNTSRTAIEPSLTLRSRMAMVMNPTEDRIIDGTFEDHHVGNKYDGIAMNPPFGSGGKTAIDHLAKAATHLRDGGRIVALIPTGPAADKKFDKWFYDKSERPVKPLFKSDAGDVRKGDTVYVYDEYQKKERPFIVGSYDSKNNLFFDVGRTIGWGTHEVRRVERTGTQTESFNAAEGLQLVANIKLPQVAFERAGTSVATRIVVLEKGGANVMQRDRDYSGITDINELFDKLEHLDFAARTKPVEAAPVEATKAEKPATAPKPAKSAANEGDEVSINGKKYEIQIYTTNVGKAKRGIWMDSKTEASKYSARTFTHSSNKGKWFVDEYWFPKDSEIIKPSTQQSHISNGDSSYEETAKVQAGIEGKSLIDAARFIEQTGTPAQAEIAKQVISKLERLQASSVKLELIVAHRGDQVPAQMGKSRGYTESGFDNKGRDITVWVAGADVTGRVGTDYETVLHEMVHAATMGVVQFGRTNPNSLAGKHVRDLSAVTSAISSHIIDRFAQADSGKTELTEFEKDVRAGANNAFRGIDEVLSWALTSPQAQSYLEGIPYKNQNLWTKLVQAIRTLLGLSPTADTALSEVLRVAENLMASDLNDHAMQAFWHKRGIGMSTIQAAGSIVLPKKNGPKSLITNQALPTTWQAPDATKMDDFIYSMQDKNIDTRRVIDTINQTIGAINEQQNPYLQEELYHGRAAMATKEFLEKQVRPLLVELRTRGITMEDLEAYLHNRHAEARNIQAAKINPDNQDMQDGGSGIKTADARAYLAALTPAQTTAFKSLAAKVEKITQSTRELLVSSGLEKQSTIGAWEQAYGDEYVPLQREEMENGMGIGQGISTRGSASKRFMGSDKKVVNIFSNIVMAHERAITRSEKKRIGEALYGLVLKAPNPDFWFAIDPALQQNPKKVMDTMMQLVNMGLDPADADSIAREPTTRYINPITKTVESRINPAMRNAENVLAVRIDGEDKFVFFNKKDERAMRMVKALKNLDSDQLGEVMGAVSKATRYFSAINTQFNPIFGVTNLLRDIQTGMLNLQSTALKGKQGAIAKNVVPALMGIYSDLRKHRAGKAATSDYAKLFEEFQREGGATGYRDMFANAKERADAIEQEIKDIGAGKAKQLGKGILGWLSDYNEAMENSVRLSAYKVAKEQGMSNQQAASLAKNLTVNFNRKGQVALQAGALYAFFNASVQGTARIAQTLTEDGKLSTVGKQILIGGLTLGAMQAVLLAAAGFDDGEPPDFVRERNLIIPIGGSKYVSIPMPLGFHVIPGLARIPTEWAMGGFKNTPKRIAQIAAMFAEAMNPIGSAGLSMQTLAPTVLDPFAALTENRDWTGKPIAKLDFNSLRPTAGHTRAKDTATPWATFLSKAVNYATGGDEYKPGVASPTPDQIDYLIGQVTGGVGREISKASQVVKSATTGEDLPLFKTPLIGRFVGTTEGNAAESSRFYENLKQIGAHKAEIDGLKRDHKPLEIIRYLRENPDAQLLTAATHVEEQIQKLTHLRRALVKKDTPPERVKAINDQITARMAQFNKMVKQRELAGAG